MAGKDSSEKLCFCHFFQQKKKVIILRKKLQNQFIKKLIINQRSKLINVYVDLDSIRKKSFEQNPSKVQPYFWSNSASCNSMWNLQISQFIRKASHCHTKKKTMDAAWSCTSFILYDTDFLEFYPYDFLPGMVRTLLPAISLQLF